MSLYKIINLQEYYYRTNDIEPLIKALKSQDASCRLSAALALGRTKDVRAQWMLLFCPSFPRSSVGTHNHAQPTLLMSKIVLW